MVLHLNQAGHALVGWFTTPRHIQGGKPSKVPSGFPEKPGCLRAVSGPDGNEIWQFEWFEGKNPDKNESDPDDRLFLPGGAAIGNVGSMLKTGRLKPINHPPDAALQEIAVAFDPPQIVSGEPPRPITIRMRRTVPLIARVPFFVMREMVKFDPKNRAQSDLGRQMAAEQSLPIPDSFWLRISKRLDDQLTPLLQEFQDAGSNSVLRLAAREKIDNFLQGLFADLGPEYDRVARERMRALLHDTKIKLFVGNDRSGHPQFDEVPALQKLEQIVQEQMDDLRKNSMLSSFSDYDLWDLKVGKGFKRLGIQPGGSFIYTLKFSSKGQSTPTFAVGFGLFAFKMTVKKEIETSAPGKPPERHVAPGWEKSEERFFGGIFAVGGAGASWDFSKMSGKGAGGGAGPPGTIEIRSFLDLQSVQDFDNAEFSVTAINVGNVGTVLGGANVLNSAFVQFFLPPRHAYMDAVVETNFAIKADLDWKSFGEAFQKGSFDKSKFIPSFTILKVSQGWGQVVLSPERTAPPPTQQETVEEKQREVSRETEIMFDVDSSVLDESRRFHLETLLAIDRALYTEGDGAMFASGFASPEASADHNQKLSEARAQAVRQAVEDAFGSRLTISEGNRHTEGKGDKPAIESGLIDPDPPGQNLFGDPRVIREMKAWPFWRRVDLRTNGVLSVRVKGRGARAD